MGKELLNQRIQKSEKVAFVTAVFVDTLLSFYLSSAFFYLDTYFEIALFGFKSFWITPIVFVLGLVAWTIYDSRKRELSFWKRYLFLSLGGFISVRGNVLLKSRSEYLKPMKLYSLAGIFSSVLLILTFLLGWLITEVSLLALLSESGVDGAIRMFAQIFQPHLNVLPIVLDKTVETIFMAFMATILAVPVAFCFSFLSARNLMNRGKRTRLVYFLVRAFSNFNRSVEPLVWAIIFSVWLGIGPFAGVLALWVHSVASLIKLYSEQIESINRGPMEAIESTGGHPIQVVWYAVVPQVLLPYLSFTIYRWDINIRMSTVIGLVGGGGVGTLLNQFRGLGLWNEVGTIIFVIVAVVWTMDYISARLREAIY